MTRIAYAFPLAIESMIYGTYSVLFYLSMYLLYTRKNARYRLHLGCMVALYTLDTAHMVLEYTLMFMNEDGVIAIYNVFSVFSRGEVPLYYSADDPPALNRIVTALKAIFILYNLIADGIILYRCYVIWGMKRRILIVPMFTYACTITASILAFTAYETPGFVSGMAMTFFTNIIAISLTAGRIWWISRQDRALLGHNAQGRYKTAIAILLESGIIYPISLLVLVLAYVAFSHTESWIIGLNTVVAVLYQVVGIAPTLIIARVGLGVSINDFGTSLATFRAADVLPDFPGHSSDMDTRHDASTASAVRVQVF